MKNKVLVIGANGMLGWSASEYFTRKRDWSVITLTRKKFDIAKDSLKKLEKYLKKSKIILNCAGIIKPRVKNTPTEEILKVNAVFPHNLAKLANKHEKFCFHITTDCVFSGKRGNYSELDFFDAEDIYGLSKAAGDTRECMTLRTSFVSEEKRNFSSLLEWVKSQKGKRISGFVNHFWNGITTLYLAEIIETIVSKGLYKRGVFHLFSSQIATKHELVSLINEVYGLNIRVRKVKAPAECNRALTTIYPLCSQVAKKSLRVQLEEMRDFFKK